MKKKLKISHVLMAMRSSLFAVVFSSFTVLSAHATVVTVSPGSNTLQDAVATATAGDILVMRDGTYIEHGNFSLDKNLTIKAADGAKPVISNLYYFKIESGAKVIIQGVEFDGSGASDHCIRSYNGSTGTEELILDGCVFHNYPSYVIYTQRNTRKMHSITISNCIFKDNTRHSVAIIYEGSTASSCDEVKVENSTFLNTTGRYAAIYIMAGNNTKLDVDHCTFHNFDSSFVKVDSTATNVAISNCIFAQPAYREAAPVVCHYGTISHCLAYNCADYAEGPTVTDSSFANPLFKDAANGNFTLGEGSPALTMNSGEPIGDPRWIPSAAPTHTYTIAGAPATLFGKEWNASYAENDMESYGTDTYFWRKDSVALAAGNVEFMIVEDHSWAKGWPDQAYVIKIDSSGIYNITIIFKPKAEVADSMISVIVYKVGNAVVMHGNFTGDWKDTEKFAVAEDNLTASLKLNLTAGSYEFGMKFDGVWNANGAELTRANASTSLREGNGNNMKITADVDGEYIFTYTFLGEQLTVTCPPIITYIFDSQMGTIQGPKTTATGVEAENITFEAISKYGYHFVQWNDSMMDNPRTIWLSQDTTFTAEFAKNTYSISTTSANPEWGTTAGDTAALYLDEIEISATPNYGYHFVKWNNSIPDNSITVADAIKATLELAENTPSSNQYIVVGYIVGKYGSYYNSYYIADTPDGESTFVIYRADNSASIGEKVMISGYLLNYYGTPEIMQGGKVQPVNSTANPYTLTVTVNETYTATFAKDIFSITANAEHGSISGNSSAEYLDEVTLTVSSNYGYHFAQWSDGNTDNPRTITLTSDTTFTAQFVKNSYTISTNSANPEWGTTAGDTAELYLEEVEISAIPNYGYHFVRWNDYNTSNPRTISVTEDKTYTATFAKNVYSITKNAEHGSISCNSSAEYLDEVTLTVSSDYGYHFSKWSDGNTDNPRTFVVTQDTTMEAIFDYLLTGKCGKDNALTWTLDSTTLALSISGKGALTENYTYGNYIESLTIGDEISPIGQGAFQSFSQLKEVTLGTSLKVLEENAFANCRSIETITCYSQRPPTVNQNALYSLDYSTVVYVPAAYLNNYLMHDAWGVYDVRPMGVALYLSANNAQYGVVEGAGTYASGSNVAFSATPNYGYHFAQWSDGNMDNPRTIVLTQDTTFVAEFAPNKYSVNVSCDPSLGSIVGKNGEYDYLSRISYEAVAHYGYQFAKWSDGNTQNPRTVTVQRDTTLVAEFAKRSFTLTTQSANPEQGIALGGKSALYLEEVEISATPNDGYTFVQWSDGDAKNPRIVVLTQDTTFVAEFAVAKSGLCGANNSLTWSYTDDRTLTISGSGALTENYTFGVEAPTQMKTLIIGNEVTAIGERAFYGKSNINHLVLGAQLATIGDYAFAECRNFDDITCYATTVPAINETTFANVGNKQYIYLYVPAERERAYKRDIYWGEFDVQIQEAEKTTVTEDEVTVAPADNSAVLTWPTNENAASYTIEISKDGEVFCRLVFNANGQLTGIAFAPSRDGSRHAPSALMTANGLQFTVTGLDSNTQYGYSVTAKDANDQTVATYSGEFTTTSEVPTSVDQVPSDQVQYTKILRNGQILILRGDKTYTITGQEVK